MRCEFFFFDNKESGGNQGNTLDSSSTHSKDSRKSNFLGFSAPGGGDREVLRRLVSQPGVTEGNPRKTP
jgi:hypothetical protein